MRSDRSADAGSRPSRRALLASLSTGSLASVAGCLASDSDGTPTADTDTPTATAAGATESPTAEAIETNGDETPTSGGRGTPTTEPVTDTWETGGPPDREGWAVTFQDRFEGGELDRTTWRHGAGMGLSPPCGTLECWERDQVRVDGQTDRLVVETTDEPSGEKEYTSGGVNTRDAFTQEFGYFEAKSRPPAVPGALPAFWMWWNPDDWTYRREIDFYEINGARAKEPIHSVHVDCERRTPGDGGPAEWRGGRSELSTGADEAFHVWGCEWTPDSVTFYVDGEERIRVEDEIVRNCLAGEELWIVLSTHVNGDMGDPTEADYPYTHEFEWVRVWQRDDWR